jgi:2-oxoglutarate dehydrogenase E1 component
MLKRKEAASQPDDFTTGQFRPFISDAEADPDQVDTLLMCSGRITWDLMVERAKREDAGRFAIARVEELYPEPIEAIKAEIARYPRLTSLRWVQDEPRNMGPWPHYRLNVWSHVENGLEVEPITRPPLSSPSVGTAKRHAEELKALIAAAFEDPTAKPGIDAQHHY